MVKAIRGAIQVPEDTPEAIRKGTMDLFGEVMGRNDLKTGEVVSLIISQTDDLASYNPATALREGGVEGIVLFCLQELKITGQLPRTIRFLLHINCDAERAVSHVYLGGAKALRPDLA